MTEGSSQSPGINATAKRESFDLENEWYTSEGLTQQEIAALFQREDFIGRVLECLERTRTARIPAEIPQMPDQQEFGFVAVRAAHSVDTTIHLSPPFHGTEKDINLHEQAFDWQSDHPEVPRSQIFRLHTHLYHGWAKFLHSIIKSKYPAGRGFSLEDLETYYSICQEEDPRIINAIAVESGKHRGEIIAVSFRDIESYRRFDPTKIYSEFLRKQTNGQNPLTAYTDAGLNLSVIRLNLQTGQINQQDVIKASNILSQATGRMER